MQDQRPRRAVVLAAHDPAVAVVALCDPVVYERVPSRRPRRDLGPEVGLAEGTAPVSERHSPDWEIYLP